MLYISCAQWLQGRFLNHYGCCYHRLMLMRNSDFGWMKWVQRGQNVPWRTMATNRIYKLPWPRWIFESFLSRNQAFKQMHYSCFLQAFVVFLSYFSFFVAHKWCVFWFQCESPVVTESFCHPMTNFIMWNSSDRRVMFPQHHLWFIPHVSPPVCIFHTFDAAKWKLMQIYKHNDGKDTSSLAWQLSRGFSTDGQHPSDSTTLWKGNMLPTFKMTNSKILTFSYLFT